MSNLFPWDIGHNFGDYQLFGARLGSQTSTEIEGVTASTVAGAIRYDSTNGRIRWSNGAAWQVIYPQNDTLDINTVPVRGTDGAIKLRLTEGNFFVGNGSNEAVITPKTSIPLSGFGAATANVAMGGQRLTGLASAVDATDAPTLLQVQNLVAGGIKFKDPVRVATTANITLSTLQTIDTISLNDADRVLVKSQDNPAQNGIYLAKAGSWVRTSDMPAAGDWNTFVPGAYVFVLDGSANKNIAFIVTSPVGGSIGTDDIDWAVFSVAPTFNAGRGIVISGGNIHFASSSAYTPFSMFFASDGSSIGSTGAGTSGQIIVGKTGESPSWVTVSGDATINSGNGNIVIANEAITLAKMADADALSVIGNGTNSADTPTYLAAGSDHQILRRSGTSIGFGSVDLSQAGAVGSSRLALTNVAQVAGYSILGNATDTTANITAIAAASEWQVLRRGGSGLEFGAVNLSEATAVSGTLPVARGGTGITSLFSGLIVLGSASNGFAQLGLGTTGQVLKQSAGNNPEWGNIDLGSSIAGILGATNGGTGFSSYTSGDILFASGASALSRLGIGSNQFVLKSVSGSPQWGTIEADGISSNAITSAKIADNAVTSGKIADNAVIANKIADSAVTTAKLNNSAVTFAKLQDAGASGLSVIGRAANSAGVFGEISAGSDHLVLRRSGSSIGFGALDISQTSATTGTLPVNRGGTGLASMVAGQILVGNATSPVLQSSSLVWDNANSRLGVGVTPLQSIHTAGNARVDGQLILPVATGTAPAQITSRTRVENLNVDQVDGADVGNIELASGVHFTGPGPSADYISAPLGTQAMGTGNASVWVRFRVPETIPTTLHVAAIRESDTHYLSVCRLTSADGGTLAVGAVKPSESFAESIVETGIIAKYGGRVIDVVTVRSGASFTVFVNGVQQFTGANAQADVDIPETATVIVNGFSTSSGSSNRLYDSIYRTVVYNRALSTTDAARLVIYGVDPADQWGNELNNVLNPTFDTNLTNWSLDNAQGGATVAWARNTSSPINGAGDGKLDVTVAGSRNDYPRIVANGTSNPIPNKRYRARFKYQVNSGAVTVRAVRVGTEGLTAALQESFALTGSGDYTSPSVKIGATSGVLNALNILFSGQSTFSLQIDDAVLQRVGAVMDLDLGIGYGSVFPDRSSNLLDGTATGNVVHLLPRRRETGSAFHGNLSATSATTFTVTHNLGTQNLICQVWRNATPSGIQTQLRGVSVETIDANQVRILFGSSVTGSNYRVTILALE
jgi:hypothetical protein